MCDECGGTCIDAEEQEVLEAAEARGYKREGLCANETGDRLMACQAKARARGEYPCDGICDANLPHYAHKVLVEHRLAAPRATPLTDEELEMESKVTATAISRAMGGPYGGPDGQLMSGLVWRGGKAQTAEERAKTSARVHWHHKTLSGKTAENFIEMALEENAKRDWTPRQEREMEKLVRKAVQGTDSYEAAGRKAISAVLALPRGQFQEWGRDDASREVGDTPSDGTGADLLAARRGTAK
jgi:hypothetical protein